MTFATLPEVTAWLNLKYGERQHPTQVIVMRDVLTCKGEMQFIHGDVKKPEDWGPYPPHVFYYDRNYQLVLRQGNPIPVRLMDYKSNLPNQNNNYPEWEVNARLLSQAIEGDYYTAQLQVNEEYVRMPLLAEILTDEGTVFRLIENEYVKKGYCTVKAYVGDLKHPRLPAQTE